MIHLVWFPSGLQHILAFESFYSDDAEGWGWGSSKLHSLQPHALVLCISRTNDNMYTIKQSETSLTAQRQSQHRGFCSLWTVLCTFRTSNQNLWASELTHFTSPFFFCYFYTWTFLSKKKKNQIKWILVKGKWYFKLHDCIYKLGVHCLKKQKKMFNFNSYPKYDSKVNMTIKIIILSNSLLEVLK